MKYNVIWVVSSSKSQGSKHNKFAGAYSCLLKLSYNLHIKWPLSSYTCFKQYILFQMALK